MHSQVASQITPLGKFGFKRGLRRAFTRPKSRFSLGRRTVHVIGKILARLALLLRAKSCSAVVCRRRAVQPPAKDQLQQMSRVSTDHRDGKFPNIDLA